MYSICKPEIPKKYLFRLSHSFSELMATPIRTRRARKPDAFEAVTPAKLELPVKLDRLNARKNLPTPGMNSDMCVKYMK